MNQQPPGLHQAAFRVPMMVYGCFERLPVLFLGSYQPFQRPDLFLRYGVELLLHLTKGCICLVGLPSLFLYALP